jgi:myo-inositol-1(or 4)-monophosphatase
MSKMKKNPKFLGIAKELAIEAGRAIIQIRGRIKKVAFKGDINLVTEADKKAEKLIAEGIIKSFPTHNILAEEEGRMRKVVSDYLWLIDPLDGTTNFVHGFPVYCVSIALQFKDKIILGVVYDPVKKELFWAQEGRKAYLNGEKISVSKTRRLSRALLATGFSYEFRHASDSNLEHFVKFLYHAQAIRRAGSAALDLCYVASGRLDGFWELGLYPWDTGAGYLIVQQASGRVTDFKGKKFNPFSPRIVASNSLIHNQMIKILSNKKFGSLQSPAKI